MVPLVSILIPAFNAEEWIADTLRSALEQIWPSKEIIVVDDGSTDQTLAIARRFEPEGVRVFTQHNQGAAATRNTAFCLSHGEYIQWLDADDLLSPDKIARQMEAAAALESRCILLSSGWGKFSYRHSMAEFIPTPLWSDLSPAEWLVRKMSHNLFMQTGTWLVSRQLTEAAGPWDTTLLGDDDGEYFCRVLLASEGVHFVPNARVYYREAGTSSLSYIGQSHRKIAAHWKSMELHIGYLLSLEDSPRTRGACVQYLQNWLLHFYPDCPDLVNQAKTKAESLGGYLVEPRLSYKYVWIKALFGWGLAKRALISLPAARGAAVRTWDRLIFRLQKRALPPFSGGRPWSGPDGR